MKKAEVYILSGFLGSGKTTLLKRLLEDEQRLGRKTAVMMNELGKVSIDSDAVEGEDVSLKELLGGCICCSIQDKLEAQLQGLLLDEKPEVIYIETTGAAHPVEVLDAILSPLFADKLLIKGILTTVDGKRWMERKSLSPQLQQLILEQVRHADFIIINKMNELKENEQAKIIFEIQSINSNARCLLTNYSQVPTEQLRKLSVSFEKEKKESQRVTINLTTFVYQFKTAISHAEFENFLKRLPDTIYRIKGYVKFDHSDLPFLFQFSYGMPIYLKEDMNMRLNLVFIGEGINWNGIETQLENLEK
ncbi:GTP-binding protein [Bacillus sp. ISL-40]|uniref:CobW family GTP-binding protein n=1 Tax=unclassified Bacillus (in: firmicutes) TaxID=185979 RepID=UPI001BE8BA53|nr:MULTISPECIES: GTP-binding protein [unclassified Bacillus (in: firmicutes)]MBT2699275.1 GTP-binding protein [Bacillus sp. ISL-40]MBT2723457.1 GTP-binding protein [Bacillus sp. ISL-46]MBT2739865.1 GTP-binding protein [Bacillus sp. ISL-77]